MKTVLILRTERGGDRITFLQEHTVDPYHRLDYYNLAKSRSQFLDRFDRQEIRSFCERSLQWHSVCIFSKTENVERR